MARPKARFNTKPADKYLVLGIPSRKFLALLFSLGIGCSHARNSYTHFAGHCRGSLKINKYQEGSSANQNLLPWGSKLGQQINTPQSYNVQLPRGSKFAAPKLRLSFLIFSQGSYLCVIMMAPNIILSLCIIWGSWFYSIIMYIPSNKAWVPWWNDGQTKSPFPLPFPPGSKNVLPLHYKKAKNWHFQLSHPPCRSALLQQVPRTQRSIITS